MAKSIRSDRINEGLENHSFGVCDKAGRDIGCRIVYSVEILESAPSGYAGCYFELPAGTYFCWHGKATRAGKDFGAGQVTHYCATEEERFEQVAKYLKSARQRAASK